MYLKNPSNLWFMASNIIWTYGGQSSSWFIFALDVEILISFAVLNENLSAKMLSRARIVVLVIWIILDIPALIYMARLAPLSAFPIPNDIEHASFAVAVFTPAALVVYDNLQSLYLIYHVIKLKKAKLEGQVVDLCLILTVLIILDFFGVACALYAVYLDNYVSLVIMTHELYSSFGFSMHGVLSIVVFSILRSIALERRPIKKIILKRDAKVELVPTIQMDREVEKSQLLVTINKTVLA